jgi:hypothetical protein
VNQAGSDAQVTLTATLGLAPNVKQTTLTPVDPNPPVVLKPGESYTATYNPSTKSGGGAAKVAASSVSDRQAKQQQQQPGRATKSGGRR